MLSVDYRKAPEHAWPAAAEDVYAVLEWLVEENSSSADIMPLADRHQVVLMGESAGGNLAACASLMWRDRQLRGVTIVHQVLLSPCIPTRPLLPSRIDPTRANGALLPAWLMEYFEEAYASGSKHAADDAAVEALVDEPYFNPLATPTMAGLPPITGVVGGAEILRDEGVAYFTAASDAGVDVAYRELPDGYHAFVIFPFGQSAEAWSFVRDRLRSSALLNLRGGALRGAPHAINTATAAARRKHEPPPPHATPFVGLGGHRHRVSRGSIGLRMGSRDDAAASEVRPAAAEEVASSDLPLGGHDHAALWVGEPCPCRRREVLHRRRLCPAPLGAVGIGRGDGARAGRRALEEAMADLPAEEQAVGELVSL